MDLINESIYQSKNNKFLLKNISYLFSDNINNFEKEISNEFIYLNGSYSMRIINNENKQLLNLEYKNYYWEGCL